MTDAISCGYARTFLWEKRGTVLTYLKKDDGEPESTFNRRINVERYRLYMKQFMDFPNFHINKGINFLLY